MFSTSTVLGTKIIIPKINGALGCSLWTRFQGLTFTVRRERFLGARAVYSISVFLLHGPLLVLSFKGGFSGPVLW